MQPLGDNSSKNIYIKPLTIDPKAVQKMMNDAKAKKQAEFFGTGVK